MELLPLVAIIIGFLVLFLIFTFIKKFVKFAFIVAIIIIILFVITGTSIQMDFTQIKEKLPEPPLVILTHEEVILMAFEGEVFVKDTLELQAMLDAQEFDHPKVHVYSTDMLLSIEEVKINNKAVSGAQLHGLFANNQGIESIVFEDLQIDLELPPDLFFKESLFYYLYQKELQMSKSPLQFFKQYKAETLQVYPESIFYQFVKLVPLSWIEEKLNKLTEAVNTHGIAG